MIRQAAAQMDQRLVRLALPPKTWLKYQELFQHQTMLQKPSQKLLEMEDFYQPDKVISSFCFS